MATDVYESLTQHSSLDNTGDLINGSEVDENANTIANVLDGTSAVELNGDTTAGVRWTNLPYTLDHKDGRILVSNNTGSTIAANALVYVSGYDSTNECYEVTKAVSATTSAASLYASLVLEAAITDGSTGKACARFILTSQNTTGLTSGRPVYLNTTAGGWTGTLPAAEYRIQVVGQVVAVHGTTGRVEINLPGSIIPWSLANEI